MRTLRLLIAGTLFVATVSPFACNFKGETDETALLGEARSAGLRGILGIPTISSPVDSAPMDGRASICVDTLWPGDCDHVTSGNPQAIRIPLSGSITIQKQVYVFDVAAIDDRRTGGTKAGQGGALTLTLTSVGSGCDVGADGFTLVADMATFWDTVEVSPDGKTMSWNMTGDQTAILDDGGCSQVRNPADLSLVVSLPVVDNNGSIANEHLVLSTVAGEGYLLPPLTITNAQPESGTLDLVFVIDTTGSMWDDIDAVKSSSIEIVESIFTDVSDARVAVIDYKDFPQSPYGDPTDYPYRLIADFSSDQATVAAAIQALEVSGGADWAESVYSGLLAAIDRLLDHAGMSLSPWRSDATKVILLLGDAPPHDPEPITGNTFQTVVEAAARGGMEQLPEVPDFAKGAGQLLGQDQVQSLSGAGILIYTLQVGADPQATTSFQALSAETGGQSFTTANAGSVATTLKEIVGIIGGIPNDVNRQPHTEWATASPSRLLPANHQMIGVAVQNVVDPDGAPVEITITAITQDEPVSSSGGPPGPDAAGVGTPLAQLRAERTGNGNGRVYRIAFIARDASGLESPGAVLVCVPHDQGENAACQDGGQLYDATLP